MKIDRGAIDLTDDEKEISKELDELIAQHILESKTLQFSDTKSQGKAHIYHWCSVLDRFDEILESACSSDPQIRSQYTNEQILAVLERTTFLLREAIIHIEHYNSFDRIETLLLSPDTKIVCASLQLLLPFTSHMKIPFANTIRALSFPLSRKQPIPLVDMLTEDISEESLIRGNTLLFEYLDTDLKKVTIFLPEVHKIPLSAEEILQSLIRKYNIPEDTRFAVFHRIRFAQEFRNSELRSIHAIAQLYALAFGNLHKLVRITTFGKVCAEQLFAVLPHPGISLDSKIHVLRCFSRLDDPTLSHYIIKRGCIPQGLIPTCMRSFISLASSKGEDSEKAEGLLIGLLANIYTYTFHDRKLQLSSSGIVSLLAFLLSNDHPKVFCFSLEILTNMIKTNPKVLQSVMIRGMDGLLKYVKLEGTKFQEWQNDSKNSNLTLSYTKLTADQQTPTTLLDALSAILLTTVRSASNRKMVSQFLRADIATLLTPILLNPKRIHVDLVNSAVNLVSTMILVEPENYLLIAEAGLCTAVIRSILLHNDLPIRCYQSMCSAIRNISLNQNGRKEIIESGVLAKFFSVLYADDKGDKHHAIEASKQAGDTLCELVNHYRADYHEPVIMECFQSMKQFRDYREEQKNQITYPRDPQEEPSNLTFPKLFSNCEIAVSKFATLSSSLFDGTNMFTTEQAKQWIVSSIHIFITFIPDNIFTMERSCTNFFSHLPEEYIHIVLESFAEIMTQRYKVSFPHGTKNVHLDSSNRELIATCYLMNYFITVLEKLDLDTLQLRSQSSKDVMKSDLFREAFSHYFDVYRCILWHSSKQDIQKMDYEYKRKTDPNFIKNPKKPTTVQRINKIDPNMFSFDSFYMRPDGVRAARISLEYLAESFTPFRTIESRSVSQLFLEIIESKETLNPLVVTQYLSRAIRYFRSYVLSGTQSYIERKLLAIQGDLDIKKILSFLNTTILDPQHSICYQILADPSHPDRPVYQELANDTMLQFLNLCDSFLINLYRLKQQTSTGAQNAFWTALSKEIESIVDPFWRPNQMTCFPLSVVQAFINVHRSITDPPTSPYMLGPPRSQIRERHMAGRPMRGPFWSMLRDSNRNDVSESYRSAGFSVSSRNNDRPSSREPSFHIPLGNYGTRPYHEMYSNPLYNSSALCPPEDVTISFGEYFPNDNRTFPRNPTSYPLTTPQPRATNSNTPQIPLFELVECLLDTKDFNVSSFMELLKPNKISNDDAIKTFINNAYEALQRSNISQQYITNLFHILRNLSNDSSAFRQVIHEKFHSWLLSHTEESLPSNEPIEWIASAISLVSTFCVLPNDHELKLSQPTPRICLLFDSECTRWLQISLQLLQSNQYSLLSPVVVATIQLLGKIVIFHEISSSFMKQNGLENLFAAQLESKAITNVTSNLQSLLRHITETAAVLQVAMENEICFLLKYVNRGLTPKEFLQVFAHLALRDKEVFFKAAYNCCHMKDKRLILYSKTTKEYTSSPGSTQKESETKVHSRRLKLPQKNFTELVSILHFLAQRLGQSETTEEKEIELNDEDRMSDGESDVKKDKESTSKKISIGSSSCVMNCISDLVTNFPQCSAVLLDSNLWVGGQEKTSVIHFLLTQVVKFPTKSITSYPWIAREKDICLLGSRLIVVLWGTKEGRKKILMEISNVLNQIAEAHDPSNSSFAALCTMDEVCSIYALTELMKILLKLRKSKEHNESLANLCVRVRLVQSLMQVLELIDLDLSSYRHAVESVVRCTELVTHLIIRYHVVTPTQPSTSAKTSQAEKQKQEGKKPSLVSNQTDSAVDLLSYMESVSADLPVDDDDDDEDMEENSDSPEMDGDNDNPLEDDEDDEDEDDVGVGIAHMHHVEDDEEEEDAEDTVHFSDSDDDENPWTEGMIPDFFFGDHNGNGPTRTVAQIRNYIRRRIRSRRDRLTSHEDSPLRNINRSENTTPHRISPSIQHTIRKIFDRTIPSFLAKRWNRWLDPDSSFTSSTMQYALSLSDSFTEMFNEEKTTTPTRPQSPVDRPQATDEPPLKNPMFSLRGRRRIQMGNQLYREMEERAARENQSTTENNPPSQPNSTDPADPMAIEWERIEPATTPRIEISETTPTPNPVASFDFGMPRSTGSRPPTSESTTVVSTTVPEDLPALDMDVLNELPEELRQEILDNRRTVEQLMRRPTRLPDGVNQEYFDALPAELQAELLTQLETQQQQSLPQPEPQIRVEQGTFTPFGTIITERVDSFHPSSHSEVSFQFRPRLRRCGYEIVSRAISPRRCGYGIAREAISSVADKRIEYEGSVLLTQAHLVTIIKLLYWNVPKLELQKLCRNLFRQKQTRELFATMLLHITCSHRPDYQTPLTLPTQIDYSQIDQLWDQLEPPYALCSRDFSPLTDPCHPLFGLTKSHPRQISLTNVIPKVVFKRILHILLHLSITNTSALREYMFIPIPTNFRSQWLGSTTPESETMLPITILFALFGEEHVVTSYKNLSSLITILAHVTKHLNQFGEKATEVNATNTTNTTNNTDTPMQEPQVPIRRFPEQLRLRRQPQPRKEEEGDLVMIDSPEFPLSCSRYLLDTLQHPACTNRTLSKLITLIKRICSNETNRKNLLSQFQAVMIDYVSKETEFTQEVCKRLNAEVSDKEKQLSLFLSAPRSPYSEPLLRIIRCCVSLFPNHWTDDVRKDCETLWNVVRSYTATVQSFYHMETVDTQQLSITTSASLHSIIEAFFVFHEHLWPPEDIAAIIDSGNTDLKNEFAAKNELFAFVYSYSSVLNSLIRQSSSLLTDALAKITLFPSLLSFDIKRKHFQKMLRKDELGHRGRGTKIRVRRANLFEDSFQKLRNLDADALRQKISVQFEGEPGVDAGGLLKDWYQELSKQIFNPNYALFIHSADSTFQPNKDSNVNALHLDFFTFCGRIIGKAIYDGAQMDVHFTRSFYKHILGKNVVWKDIEAIDPEFYKNLQWLLENNVSALDMTFTTEQSSFGRIESVDLVENGSEIPVTESNKHEYVQLIANYKMTKTIEEQINAFKNGFYELIPHSLISMFNELELELLISGLPDIDVQDMKRNTEYRGYSEDSPVIRYFWNVVTHRFSNADRASLLQFVTGSSQVPLDGFASLQGMNGLQKFRIVKTEDTKRLPTAHTCFNQLDLPPYRTEDELEKQLLIAIKETAGFGFA